MVFFITAKAIFIAIAEPMRDDEVDLFQGSVLRQESAYSLDGNPI